MERQKIRRVIKHIHYSAFDNTLDEIMKMLNSVKLEGEKEGLKNLFVSTHSGFLTIYGSRIETEEEAEYRRYMEERRKEACKSVPSKLET